MTVNRITLILISLVAVMQAAILYRQYAQTSGMREPVRAAPEGAVIDLSRIPIQGSQQGKVLLIEFSDYECPFCQRHATGVGREIVERYVETARLRVGFANNPLPIHPNARLMATSAICAGNQGRYWEMHDALFETQPATRLQTIALAEDIGLRAAAFEECLDDDSTTAMVIDRDVAKAQELGLTGTPGFALGFANSNDNIMAVEVLISGAAPLSTFSSEIDRLLDMGVAE